MRAQCDRHSLRGVITTTPLALIPADEITEERRHEHALEVAIDDAVEVCFEARGTTGAKVPQFRLVGH